MRKFISGITILILQGCTFKDINVNGDARGINNAVIEISGNDNLWAANIIDEKFYIPVKLEKEDFYNLKIYFNGKKNKTIEYPIYLEKGNYNVSLDSAYITRYPLISATSTTQNDLVAYYALSNPGSAASTREFVAKHPNSLLSGFLLSHLNPQTISKNPKLYLELYDKLSPDIKKTKYGKKALSFIKSFNMTGMEMPALKGITPDGKPFNNNLIKGKLTLIAFWASWNNSSTRDIPELKSIYQDLHPKGFEIVGIAIDKHENRWKKFIIENELNWLHVADFKGAYSENFEQFNTNKLPCYIIVGPDLRIVEHTVPLKSVRIYFNDFRRHSSTK